MESVAASLADPGMSYAMANDLSRIGLGEEIFDWLKNKGGLPFTALKNDLGYDMMPFRTKKMREKYGLPELTNEEKKMIPPISEGATMLTSDYSTVAGVQVHFEQRAFVEYMRTQDEEVTVVTKSGKKQMKNPYFGLSIDAAITKLNKLAVEEISSKGKDKMF
ncbi:MAG: hypothetical protein KDD53_13335, partial [Bdellovibrionales bacterium]|nr:hypothetical protein [Bdellovibrionales bacterium]